MKKILVALSGGVDSATAAFLLKQQGYAVTGAFMRVWQGRTSDPTYAESHVQDARVVAERLAIPFHVFDFSHPFKQHVVDYFLKEYTIGRTPNPCCRCNTNIKFKLFLEKADELGLDGVATGHYVKNDFDPAGHTFRLREGVDKHKDQSYFLFLLTQEQLARSLFPLGSFTKDETRALAQKEGYGSRSPRESQEICFIPHNDYSRFLTEECGLAPYEGIIRNTSGRVLGKHEGYFNFTVGQRRGLGIGATQPLYVVAVDSERNEVIVGKKEEAMRGSLEVKDVNWIAGEPKCTTVNAQVRVRYNQTKINARITVKGTGAEVALAGMQEVITPGQAAVFYDGDIVLGGGWIV